MYACMCAFNTEVHACTHIKPASCAKSALGWHNSVNMLHTHTHIFLHTYQDAYYLLHESDGLLVPSSEYEQGQTAQSDVRVLLGVIIGYCGNAPARPRTHSNEEQS